MALGNLSKIQDLITYTIVELNPLRVNEASVAEGKFTYPSFSVTVPLTPDRCSVRVNLPKSRT